MTPMLVPVITVINFKDIIYSFQSCIKFKQTNKQTYKIRHEQHAVYLEIWEYFTSDLINISQKNRSRKYKIYY